MTLFSSRSAAAVTAAAFSSALLACSAPAKPAAISPAPAPTGPAPAPAARAPKLVYSFDDEALGSSAGFGLDQQSAPATLAVRDGGERGGKTLALTSKQAPTTGAAATSSIQAGVVLPAEAVAALRGRRVEITAAMKLSGGGAGGRMTGLFGVDMQLTGERTRRFRSPSTDQQTWQTLRIVIDVQPQARAVGMWFWQSQPGEVQLDDLRFRDVGPLGAGDVAPRPIEARGLQNLMALARLYGAVRYFHPSDEAARADWDRLLIEAIEPVERAADASALAEQLTAVFHPVAPSLTIAAGAQAPRNAIPATAPAPGATPLRWRHRGVRTGASSPLIYDSQRVESLMAKTDQLVQFVDVSALGGQTLDLSAFLRITGAPSVLLLAGTSTEEEPAYAVVSPPARATQWTQAKLQVKVPPGAKQLFVMVQMGGPGQLMLDDVSLRAAGDAGKRELLANGDFEEENGSVFPARWGTALDEPGYQRRGERKGCHGGKGCASLTAKPQPASVPGEAETLRLPGGVTVELPLVVWRAADQRMTWPRGAGFTAPAQPRFAMASDRSTRLASVMVAWSAVQSFYPYFDVVKVDWAEQLARALSAAATDEDGDQLTETLEHMTRAARDGHARVLYGNSPRAGRLPIKLQRLEGKWILTGIAENTTLLGATGGDELISIDGEAVAQLDAALRPRVSASTPQYEDVQVEQRLLSGAFGDIVKLQMRDASGADHLVLANRGAPTLVREAVRKSDLYEPAPGVLYLDVGAISEERLKLAWPVLAAARGVILDLRGYTNRPAIFEHLVGQPVATPWWLLPIATRPEQAGLTFEKVNSALAATAPRITAKLVVLADGRTVSAMETYLSMIKHYKLGIIVGETSAGTNGDVNQIALPSGHTVAWTGLRVLDPAGGQHHGVGVAPDVKVSPTVAGVRAGKDEIYERGLAVLRAAMTPATTPATKGPARR